MFTNAQDDGYTTHDEATAVIEPGTPTDQPILPQAGPAPVHLIHPVLVLNPNAVPFQAAPVPVVLPAPWALPANWLASLRFREALRQIPHA
jgi:hypothetical protein